MFLWTIKKIRTEICQIVYIQNIKFVKFFKHFQYIRREGSSAFLKISWIFDSLINDQKIYLVEFRLIDCPKRKLSQSSTIFKIFEILYIVKDFLHMKVILFKWHVKLLMVSWTSLHLLFHINLGFLGWLVQNIEFVEYRTASRLKLFKWGCSILLLHMQIMMMWSTHERLGLK